MPPMAVPGPAVGFDPNAPSRFESSVSPRTGSTEERARVGPSPMGMPAPPPPPNIVVKSVPIGDIDELIVPPFEVYPDPKARRWDETENRFIIQHNWPPAAIDLHDTTKNIPNFPLVTAPQLGDIVALGGGHFHGHAGISLGGNLMIYAGQDGVKVGTINYVKQQDGFTGAVTFRRYVPKR